MNADSFLDSNIPIYAATGKGPDSRKREVALKLIRNEKFGISAQVLQEFFVTVVKKSSIRLSVETAMEWIEQLTEFPCQATDHQLVRIAIAHSNRYGISYWDAAIVAAAESLGAKTIYSEDLNHGQAYGRVRVVNPFLLNGAH